MNEVTVETYEHVVQVRGVFQNCNPSGGKYMYAYLNCESTFFILQG